MSHVSDKKKIVTRSKTVNKKKNNREVCEGQPGVGIRNRCRCLVFRWYVSFFNVKIVF